MEDKTGALHLELMKLCQLKNERSWSTELCGGKPSQTAASFTDEEDVVGRAVRAVSELIRNGADVNEVAFGKTPLCLAVTGGAPEIVKLLVDADADVMNANDSGFSAFWFTLVEFGYSFGNPNYLEILRILLMGKKASERAEEVITFLDLLSTECARFSLRPLKIYIQYSVGMMNAIISGSLLKSDVICLRDDEIDDAIIAFLKLNIVLLNLPIAKAIIYILLHGKRAINSAMRSGARRNATFRKSLEAAVRENKVDVIIPECTSRIRQNGDESRIGDCASFFEWVSTELNSPRSLRRLCRHVIVANIHDRLITAVPQFEIPTTLREFLLFNEIDQFENKTVLIKHIHQDRESDSIITI